MKIIKENLSGVCVCCGAPVPEGRMICPMCEKEIVEPTTRLTTDKKNISMWKKGNLRNN